MSPEKRSSVLALAVALIVTWIAATPAIGDGDRPDPSSRRRVVRGADLVDRIGPFIFDGDLRELAPAPRWRPGDPIKEVPRRHYRDVPERVEPAHPTGLERDPLLQRQERAPAPRPEGFAAPRQRLAGQGYNGVNPPDTIGDVGASYYIQAINASAGTTFTVYDKSDGSMAAGPLTLDSLGSGFCADGLGDPVVVYDHLAGRWLLSEFSNSGNRMCVYVSQTGDPISGGWYNYDFTAPNFPDYPKYAVWGDAYYVTANESSPAVYALQRSEMLTGAAAAMQRFTAPPLGGFGFQVLTPGDVDGPAPPAGAPGTMIRHRDDEAHNPGSNNPSQDYLEIFEVDVDWANAANSTFTGPTQIAVAEFDSDLCGLTSFECIQQPGTSTRLDPLREPVMWRAQYRNFGAYETLVGSFVTDVNGSDRAGVRWFELRRAGGAWGLHQEGTYSIDSTSRFMSSTAMDGDGNLATAYNVSSSSVHPGLRYAGRLASDPAGTLPQGELTLVSGSASNSANRYGDYSSLNLDPVDECTFWFTGEYNASSSWSTWIASFSFDGCGGGGGGNTAPQVTISSPADGASFTEGDSVSFFGSSSDAEDGNLTPSLSWTSSLGGAIGTGASFSTSSLSVGTHTVTASVTDLGSLSGSDSITVTVNPVGGGCTSADWTEDFEGSTSSWTTGDLWHLTTNSTCASPGYSSATHAMYYGQDGVCTYDTGSTTAGNLVSGEIAGIAADSVLTFQYFRQVEETSNDPFETTQVDVQVVGDATWTTVWSKTSLEASENAWTTSGSIALRAYGGKTIRLRFRFDSVDGELNEYVGWLVDDVQVTNTCSGPGAGGEAIFSDGFELGNLSAWSSSVGGP